MSIKIELIERYIILTNSVTGEVLEYPAQETRYKCEGVIVSLINIQNALSNVWYPWTDYTDADGNPWADLPTFIYWLRLHTGGVESMDYFLEVSRGTVDGVEHINKFGGNADVAGDTTEDVWDGSGIYTFPTTADITHLHQAVNQAAMLGGTIEVQGLDANWDRLTQTKDLDLTDTTTLVALDTPLIRVFRMRVLEDVVADSDIHCTNAGDTIEYALMVTPNNQTLMSIFTVPRGYRAYMTHYYCTVVPSTNKTPKNTRFRLAAADRANGYEFQTKHFIGIPENGDMVEHNFLPYASVGEKTDIKISANPIGEDGDVASGFDLILVRE